MQMSVKYLALVCPVPLAKLPQDWHDLPQSAMLLPTGTLNLA